jgi:hypothetical protein
MPVVPIGYLRGAGTQVIISAMRVPLIIGAAAIVIIAAGSFFVFHKKAGPAVARTQPKPNPQIDAKNASEEPNPAATTPPDAVPEGTDPLQCDRSSEKGKSAQRVLWNGYVATLKTGAGDNEAEDMNCEISVQRGDQKPVFQVRGYSTRVNEHTGEKIIGDKRAVIVESDVAGGAHCCTTYAFLTLDDPAALVAELTPGGGLAFKDTDNDGRTELWVTSGSFDYFDGLCHACSPFPTVVYRFENGWLKHVTPQFCKEIEYGLKESGIDGPDFVKFRNTPSGQKPDSSEDDVRSQIVGAAAQQMICGQEQEAEATINKTWPAWDKDRILEEIRKRVNVATKGT